jgi:predicted amidohydrolase
MPSFRAACIQNTATRDIEANIEWVCARIDESASAGAEFIALPETVGLIEPVNEQIPAATFAEADDIGLAAFRNRARTHGVTILVGSQLILEHGKIFNRCFLIDSSGDIRARYDKLHMFDIELRNGEAYRESDAIEPGDRAVVVETAFGRLFATISALARFTGSWHRRVRSSLPFPRRLPRPPGRRTGTHWCVLERSKPAPSSSRRISAGIMRTSVILSGTP